MELSFMAGAILFTIIWWFRKPIMQKSEDVELNMKVSSAESGIESAERCIAVKKEIDALGDIPNVDDLLDQLRGKHSRVTTTADS